MRSEISEHGVKYFVDRKVICPECDSYTFTIQRVDKSTRTVDARRADGEYRMSCSKCGCVFCITIGIK